MKVIIAGSRIINQYGIVTRAITKAYFAFGKLIFTEIVSGGAKGVDKLAKEYAQHSSYLKYKEFPALWEKYGRKAGYIRNVEMANYADALIAIWDGKSKGTKMMIDIAKRKGLKIYIYKVENENN